MNKATTDFVNELQNDQNVIGIILFGSWARGNHREDSDVDLVVLLNEGYKRAIEVKDEQVFEIIYTTPSSALTYWEDHRDDCFGLWSVAKILHSKNEIVEDLQKKVTAMLELGKPAISEAQKEQTFFDKKDKLKYIKSIYPEDATTANLMLFSTASELSELFFDLRLKWTPAPKQRLQQIEEIDTTFSNLLRNFYAESTSTQRRWEMLEEMIELVFNKR
jgi:hypothetical protein